MYYITNQSQEVLAVETTLLKKLNVATLAELYQKMALDEIRFEKKSATLLSLHFQDTTESHRVRTSTLSTFLGELTLVAFVQTQEDTQSPTLLQTTAPKLTLIEDGQKQVLTAEKTLIPLEVFEALQKEAMQKEASQTTETEKEPAETLTEESVEEESQEEQLLEEPEAISLANHTDDAVLNTLLEEVKEEEIVEESPKEEESDTLLIEEETQEPQTQEPKEEVALSLDDENEDDLLQTILEEAKEEEPLLLDEEEKEPKKEVSLSLDDENEDDLLQTILEEAKEEEPLLLDEEAPKEEVSLSLDDENEDDLLQTILEEAKEEEPLLLDEGEKEPKEEVSLSLDDENEDDLLQTILEEAKEEEPLLLDEEAPKESKEEVALSLDDTDEEDEPLEMTPIYIDAEHISQEIGISTEEYNEFLDEYIDTVLESDEALNGDDEEAKQKAIQNLSHLSTILHLPILTELMTTIEQSSGKAQTKAIEKLYHTLNRFTTTPQEAQKATKEADLQEEVTPNVVEEAPQKENVQEKETIDNDLLDLGLGDVTANVESLTQEEDVLVEKNDGIELDLDALTLPVEEEPQPQQKSQDDAITLDLDALTTPLVEEEKVEEKAPQSDAFDLGLDLSEETNTPVTPAIEEVEAEVIEEEAPASEGFGTINLDDVKPIHFDFQIEEAANDLSLPTELIEEFVQDFIEQGHEETQKMLKAYEAGDLETIQKIGHLLKGTSSNLRITPLADTLYEIQFCEDSSQLEGLIKNYWAHFISFETQIKLLSNS